MGKAAIIMGSDSDLSVMKEAAEMLEELKVEFELTIVSAHRTPQRMFDFAKNAEKKFEVIIAGAGGAAHLPGMVASITSLPVIGVPIKTSSLNGKDSLYSIVQMPKGVAVATVAIDNAKNAGLLAAQILALKDEKLMERVKAFKEKQRKEVEGKAEKLEKLGWKKYNSQEMMK
ncbi:MAG TPA: 5-(carboxyamino)imidazole ribonucleotide mutase [archaeon]|nr:5-(carboxyamino)imidazole ribonucleotide mutase [archaeon]